jgi:hypothetical protein
MAAFSLLNRSIQRYRGTLTFTIGSQQLFNPNKLF